MKHLDKNIFNKGGVLNIEIYTIHVSLFSISFLSFNH